MEDKETKPSNPQAFPTMGYEYINNSDESPTHGLYGGMTLRDYFAAKAVAAMCVGVDDEMDFEQYAKLAYAAADAMLRERSKGEE